MAEKYVRCAHCQSILKKSALSATAKRRDSAPTAAAFAARPAVQTSASGVTVGAPEARPVSLEAQARYLRCACGGAAFGRCPSCRAAGLGDVPGATQGEQLRAFVADRARLGAPLYAKRPKPLTRQAR